MFGWVGIKSGLFCLGFRSGLWLIFYWLEYGFGRLNPIYLVGFCLMKNEDWPAYLLGFPKRPKGDFSPKN